ncbi:MAG: DUF2167 domain-containing protein [Bacteroidota bacterium]
MKLKVLLLISSLVFTQAYGNDSDSLQISPEITEAEYQLLVQQYLDSIENTLTYETGRVELNNGMATIEVPAGFKYLNGEDSEMILTDIWGNPPSEAADRSMGMIVPENTSPLQDSSYSINITYSEEGYIEDDDAKSIDYHELLETMQEESRSSNEERERLGYPTVELVGWASPPYYDAAEKKLHWAKELKFGESPQNTLNYNIRILGRKGYLQLNAIGEMYVLEDVQRHINPILSSVNFKEGHRYADFNPDLDQVAAYGIGGLIAGKVLMKAGFFAKIGLVLAKFWKIIALGVIGLFAGIRKMFGSGPAA